MPIWQDTLHLEREFPLFGSGLGTFDTVFLKYQTAVVDRDFNFAHNDYLQFAAELGMLGLAILGALMLTVFVKAIGAVAAGLDQDWRFLGLGCAGGIAAIAIHSVADFNMYIPANALLLAWICGIAAGIPARGNRLFGGRAGIQVFRVGEVLAGFLLIAYAVTWIVSSRLHGDYRAERWFCRLGVCDVDAMIQEQTALHGGSVGRIPALVLEEALLSEPSSPWRWCDLGEAAWKSGRVDQARYCFAKGIELGPDVPPVLMRAADFYYEIHENPMALAQLGKILKATSAYDEPVFRSFFTHGISAADAIRDILSNDARAGRAYLDMLTFSGRNEEAARIWAWLVAQHYLDQQSAERYVNFLFNDRRYEQAVRAWADYAGASGDGYSRSNYVFNGDFEADPAANPFDWRLDQRAGVKVSIDSGVAHSGKRSVRVDFDGTEDVEWIDFSQNAYLPAGDYRLRAWVKLDQVTTDQGVSFAIGGNRWKSETENLTATSNWRAVEKTFHVPANDGLAQIRLFRRKSWKFDSLVKGRVWVDDVRIEPAR